MKKRDTEEQVGGTKYKGERENEHVRILDQGWISITMYQNRKCMKLSEQACEANDTTGQY